MPDVKPPTAYRSRRRFGDLLIEQGLLTAAQVEEALRVSAFVNGRRERLGETVVRLGMADDAAVARALADQLQLEFLGASTLPVQPDLAQTIPVQLAQRHRMLPLWRDADGTVTLVCADPTDIVALDDVRAAAGTRLVRLVVAPGPVVEAAIRSAFGGQEAADLIEAIEPRTDEADPDEDELSSADAPVIRLAERIISVAIDQHASDIHIEPGQRECQVRYRIDGVLQSVMVVPRAVARPLLSRLKLIAGMDIAERRRPQDGRSHFQTRAQEVDLRVSTLPSLHGETIVLRLLSKGTERLGMEQIGMGGAQQAAVTAVAERPQGLIFITGPTGSGKTSTLYGLLGHLAGEERNVITIEDPVEYELGGVNQTQVDDRIGLTFARALRTVLRQDPDVVMVGEVRDPETAELALQASLTGHMVLSTLHTNDAPGAIVRLRDLGVPSYLLASALTLVVAQRLVRVVCRDCAAPTLPTDREIAQLHLAPDDAAGRFVRGVGCATCGHTGYRGRAGLFEILTVDARMRELLVAHAPESALRHAARVAGMRSLREDGLEKALAGTTSLEEVLRATPTDVVDAGACPVCAETVEDDFVRCPWCGAHLRPAACSTCARPIDRGWRLCPGCGTPIEALQRPPSGKPILLVVDDDPVSRGVVAALLREHYEIVEADGGVAALEAVHVARPDLVLLDVVMPDMDGYAVTRELRRRPTTMHLPIVLRTAREDAETELAGLRAGADDHLTKSADAAVLIARLEAVHRRVAGVRP